MVPLTHLKSDGSQMLSDCTGRAFSFNILGIIKNIETFGRFDFLPTLFFQVVSPCLRDFVFLPCLLEITYAHLALHLVNSSQSNLNFEFWIFWPCQHNCDIISPGFIFCYSNLIKLNLFTLRTILRSWLESSYQQGMENPHSPCLTKWSTLVIFCQVAI